VKLIIRLGTTGLIYLFLFWRATSVLASTVPVSASVPDLSFNPPTLIAPIADATVNTARPSFSWSRPSPVPSSPLSYYDFYLDDTVFAASVSDSLVTQDYYFYTASASAGTFNILLKTDLAQGYHTWKVIAYTENGISSASETRLFYLDSITPFISVTKVDNQTLSWNTSVPTSIPSIENRYLTISTSDPIIGGGIETYSNIQIVLVCPAGLSGCSNQIFTGNISTGLWNSHFYGLQRGRTYTVTISATDAAGNTNLFPDFFITFGTPIPTITPTSRITPTSIVTPTASVSAPITPSIFPPLPSISIAPPINELNIITPASYVPATPPAPTPPPVKKETAFKPLYLFYLFLLILMVFGLPLHLLMASIGTATPLRFTLKFLTILAFPFFRKKSYQTIPFSSIDIFIPDKLDHAWQSTIADIKGFYSLRSPIPDKIFIEMSAVGRSWKNNLFRGSLIPLCCLCPLLTSHQDGHTRLRKTLYDNRIIPLIIALITSTTAFVITPSYFIFIYLYFSLQYLFSEYIYPKI